MEIIFKKEFVPDYRHVQESASNIEARRLPLYEHIINIGFMEKVLNKSFGDLLNGDYNDKKEFLKTYCSFFKMMGYDTISFEHCIGSIMPGSGALGDHKEGVIKTEEDFKRYPWDSIPDLYFEKYSESFEILKEVMPDGMKAIGGPGNGIFECVQDIVGYMNLCYISADNPELYSNLFKRVGDTNLKIWKRFLAEFEDIYCVFRFGDDLGFKSNTLLPADDVKEHIIPQYKRIVDEVHKYKKPFLLHSCGCIFPIMEELINIVKIDAKHSNEDLIAPFSYWVDTYGDKIGNFGGIDTDAVCGLNHQEMKEYIHDVIRHCSSKGGFAFGSGNSIPDFVPVDGYLTMIKIVREYRGDFKN